MKVFMLMSNNLSLYKLSFTLYIQTCIECYNRLYYIQVTYKCWIWLSANAFMWFLDTFVSWFPSIPLQVNNYRIVILTRHANCEYSTVTLYLHFNKHPSSWICHAYWSSYILFWFTFMYICICIFLTKKT